MDNSIPDSVIDLTIEPELYLVVFPTEFPPEGECDEQDIDIGFTNSPAIGELMERSTRDPNLPKWEFVDLSHPSKIAKERILMKHNIKKEDCVKVKGWDKEDYGLWITPGLLSALELAKVYNIQYEWNSSEKCFAKTGYTNKHAIAGKVKAAERLGWRWKINVTVILVKNEEELTKLRDEDGGPKRIALWECEGEGVEGWITDGCVLPSNDNIDGITNHAFLRTLIDELIETPGFQGWEAEDLRKVTRKALKRKKEEYEDEGLVEILGEEWKADNNGRWATPGLMKVLRSCRYYEITYRFRPRTGSPDVYKTGYTNSYSIAKGIERILKLPGRPYSRFDKCDVKLVASEKDFKRYQDSDGRCERLFKEGVDGEIIDDGWITKGFMSIKIVPK
ncbi:hypothetical protein J4E90_006831 [Alternaria incomplexa]|uniref:uncharacterized protein n=1 Tax=Alternaria incomplexa TaxID=1187928 RepID=UPI00221FF706|nr:uncharacterized protein J4E90_006831 [Alternaria incomplexa]KAI4912012.1 hypothetical protein J4E90_006831 [Alternaria incomplexa]